MQMLDEITRGLHELSDIVARHEASGQRVARLAHLRQSIPRRGRCRLAGQSGPCGIVLRVDRRSDGWCVVVQYQVIELREWVSGRLAMLEGAPDGW